MTLDSLHYSLMGFIAFLFFFIKMAQLNEHKLISGVEKKLKNLHDNRLPVTPKPELQKQLAEKDKQIEKLQYELEITREELARAMYKRKE